MRKVLNVVHPYTFVDGHYIPIGKGAARKNLAHLVKAALQNNIEVLCYLHPSEDKIDKSIGFLENPKIRRYCTTDAGEPTEDNEEEIRRFLKSLGGAYHIFVGGELLACEMNMLNFCMVNSDNRLQEFSLVKDCSLAVDSKSYHEGLYLFVWKNMFGEGPSVGLLDTEKALSIVRGGRPD